MICRLCLQDREQCKKIFDIKGIELNIAPLVKKYLYLELTANDTVSTYVCNSCWFRLSNFQKFYCNIEEAQSKLPNKICGKQKVESCVNDDNSRDNSNTSLQGTIICRLCLQGSKQYKRIFDSKGIELNIAPLVKKHLCFEITSNDTVSTNVCNSCWFRLENFHKFYCNIEEAQSKLPKEIFIKQEVEFSDNDDNSRDGITTFKENNIEKENPLEKINETLDSIKHEKIEIYDEENSVNESDVREEIVYERVYIRRNPGKPKKPKSIQRKPGRPRKPVIESELKVKRKRGRPAKIQEEEEKPKELSEHAKKLKEMNDTIKKHMKIQCELCPTECPTFGNLTIHYRDAHNKRKGYLTCCNRKFFESGYLLDHIKTHKNPNHIRCELCNKSYASKKSLRVHNIIVHTPEENNAHKCDVCSKGFPRKYMLDVHKLTHMPEEEWKYNCEQCGKSFASKYKLQTHVNTSHKKIYSEVCGICGKILYNKSLFRKHQLEHDGVFEPKAQCQECGKWVKNEKLLKRHMKRHREKEEDLKSSKQYKCDICGKIIQTRDGLRKHTQFRHEMQAKYPCSKCKKSFKTSIRLKEHMVVHTGEELYACPSCPETFKCCAYAYSHYREMHKEEWEKQNKNRVKIMELFEKSAAKKMHEEMEEDTPNGSSENNSDSDEDS